MKTQKLGSGVGFGHRTLGVERLEGRAMLAGNVTAFVDGGGNLIVRGDNNDNAVLVQQTATGQYSVTGVDFADSGVSGFRSGPTNINGSANGTVFLSGVTGD